mgnify:CR=1 FL=1
MSEAVDRHGAHKALIAPMRAAMADFSEAPVRRALEAALTPGAAVRLSHPLGGMTGPAAFYDRAYVPLLAAMRFHEFYRIEAGRVEGIQALRDIPEVMMQASAWPVAPSHGREWLVPGLHHAQRSAVMLPDWREAG